MAENGNGGPDVGGQQQINDLLKNAQGLVDIAKRAYEKHL